MLRRALPFVLLLGCHRADRAAPPAAEVYAGTCARCHGVDGAGGLALPLSPGGPAPRNFTDAAFQASRTDAELKETIRAGKPPAMPAFGAMLDDTQLTGLVAQIRSFKK